ncbi:MAG: amidohydrolase family protein [Lachnospiraceae bacterium]|nr:amidohydrolase family protein [Robinsoniella sp.]MDY3765632.1 amidohydrolase family protein [Lachnospiraceae bacterium]
MIIDFHTHIFPEKIAERAISKLAAIVNLTPSIDGCAEGLRASMKKADIDISVVLPVVTDVKQFDSILRFAVFINETYASVQEQRLLSLAGIHPDDPDYKTHLVQIKHEGFAGIKLHPNYQNVAFNDIRMKNLLYAASEIGLSIITHAGFDPYTPDHEFCTPDMVLDVLKDVAPENLILAHLGCNENYDEAEEKLCGQNVYLDTAYSITHVSETQFIRMVRKHGADKILFATDCPWAEQKTCVEILKKCALTDREKELILSTNARKLLGIK